jgi:hypothetical protein
MDAPPRFRVLDFSAFDDDAEPVRVRSVENDDASMVFLPFTPGGNGTPPPPTAAPAPVRQKCGTRARSSRGRAVRVRGSRRSTAAAHSSSSDDPGLGDEPPRKRRVAA